MFKTASDAGYEASTSSVGARQDKDKLIQSQIIKALKPKSEQKASSSRKAVVAAGIKHGDGQNMVSSGALIEGSKIGPNTIKDCDQLVSDCYEKLLDKRIVELQSQMKRLEMKYWGNRVR